MPIMTPASTRPSGRPRTRRRRRTAVAAALALVVGLAAACEPDTDPPRWTDDTPAEATELGPHLALDWPDAVGATRYQVKLFDGTPVPMVNAATSKCVVVGLLRGYKYGFMITAYDGAGNWSGDLPPGTPGHGTKVVTARTSTVVGASGGPTLRCVPTTDTDADRLPDALESGNGSFAHGASTGTSPSIADSDEDGLGDGDEVLGTPSHLNLLDLGVRPTGKDILVEVDWASEVTGCSASLRPTATWIDPIRQAFAAMPVSGAPGGPGGVKLIVDYGQGASLTGGNAIPDPDGRLNGDPAGTLARTDNFAPARNGYFHYTSISTEIQVAGVWGRQGVADYPGDEFKLGFGCNFYPPHQMASLFMHELGHNLYLHHGGHEPANRKPNYSSVMNYRYMNIGADANCDGRPETWRLEYSDEVRGPIDENHIDEVAGICPGTPADIDLDGTIDPAPYAFDVNGGGRSILHGSDDFEHIDLAAFADTDPQRSALPSEIVDVFP